MTTPLPKKLVVRDARLTGRIEVDHLSIEKGQCLVLCGPNGSGKSSLLRLLAGLEPEATGSVHLSGMNLKLAQRRAIAAEIGWLPQRPHLGEFITCESIVVAARFRFQESPARSLTEAHRILSAQGILHLAKRPASQVSGGELQRVLIASLVAQDTPFLLVDEPANHLDPLHQIRTYQRLGQLWREEGRTIVLVTHDVRLVRLLGPAEEIRIFGVKEGRLLPETSLADPRLGPLLSELYGVTYIDPDLPGGLSVNLSEPPKVMGP